MTGGNTLGKSLGSTADTIRAPHFFFRCINYALFLLECNMVRTRIDAEQTQRLREWIDMNYSGRGMFATLEADSQLPAQRWKNVYYKRQYATEEMISFVHSISTKDYQWVTTGVRTPEADGSYPFLYSPPTPDECKTVTSRLVWVIKEFAAPKGKTLFTYLEDRYQETTADAWAGIILSKEEATPKMIEYICKERRHFAEWVVTGDAHGPQVNPADSASVDEWKKRMSEKYPFLSVDKASLKQLVHGNQEN
jgi:hypothetical protein